MNELTLDNKIYVSSKRAAELTGYAKDYVGQLCREGRVDARLVGRNWYVLKDAIKNRRFELLTNEDQESSQTYNPDRKIDEDPIPGITSPTYQAENYEVFPSVNRLVDARVEVEEPKNVMSGLNDAWSTWFSGEQEKETQIPEKIDEGTPEKVNLRRIREYAPDKIEKKEIQDEEAPFESPKYHARSVSVRKTAFHPLLIRAIFVCVVLGALFVGYVGSTFYTPSSSTPKQVKFISGTTLYDKTP